MIHENIIEQLFGKYSGILKERCTATPPHVVESEYGSSEESEFVDIVKANTDLNILHKSQNPNYIALWEAHLLDKKDWRYTDFDRKEGDFYLNGYRVDLKVASKPMRPSRNGKLPSFICGAIGLASIVDFARGDRRSVYLSASKDWSRMFIISADDCAEWVSEHAKYMNAFKRLRQARTEGRALFTERLSSDECYILINDLPESFYKEIV